MNASAADANQPGFRWKWLLYVGAAVALIAAAKYFHVQDLLKQALDWVGQLGPWGPVIFIGLYVVATVLFVPGSVLTLGATIHTYPTQTEAIRRTDDLYNRTRLTPFVKNLMKSRLAWQR